MNITAIKTRPLVPPKDDLLGVITEVLSDIQNGDVIAVSSKVVAIWQGRTVQIPKNEEAKRECKEALVKKEAEQYLEKDARFPYSRMFTIYEGMFGSSSGIDESNGDGYFILLPKNVDQAAADIRNHLVRTFGIRDVGVVIVDSRSTIMRNGTTGIALGHAGFQALADYRGSKDVFGRELQFERMHIADCLASAATLAMGEGNEQTPITRMRDVPHMVFGDEASTDFMLASRVALTDDVYAQFLVDQPWKRGGRE